MAIEEIYLIHHTHTDIGYTDLPSTTWKLHVSYIREAIAAANATQNYPPEAQFRWTCEALYMVEAFLQQASAEERQAFAQLVDEGRFEVTAMPFNITPFLGKEEWLALTEHLRPLREQFQARTALQNDINGLPWGLLPTLQASGVQYIWTGMNRYCGGSPLPPPTAFWWEGPTGERMLTWVGFGYGDGYSWFHKQGWRRGPVPSVHDVWFNPPAPDETFDASPQGLETAFACLQSRLATLSDYAWSVLPLQVTNMWRIDNDPPCRHLSDFVRAWNAAGYTPRLRLATPRQFMHRLEQQVGTSLPVVRGDWPDWWADGSTSTPIELALNQRTKQLLADLPLAAQLLSTTIDPGELSALWHMIALMDEHTWGAYDSIAPPYKPRAQGSWMQKMLLAYQGHEDAHIQKAATIRSSPAYCTATKTRYLTVLNPGKQVRSGWADISTRTWHETYNAVRDTETGEIFPLETLSGLEWDTKAEKPATYFDVPDNTWNVVTTQKRFYVRALLPESSRRFELLALDLPASPLAETSGQNDAFRWTWHPTTGALQSWIDCQSGLNLVDEQAPFGLGDVIFEQPHGWSLRDELSHRDGEKVSFERSTPRLLHWQALPGAYGARYQRVWEHPHYHRIEQQWDFPHHERRVDVTTTFWLKETIEPQAIFLAFPWSLPECQFTYYSLDYPTRVGHDQIPGSCGEYLVVNEGIELHNQQLRLALSTLDTPLGACEHIHTRNGQQAFVPDNAHFYAYVTQNYWSTNFSITRAGKLVTRHSILLGEPQSELLSQTNSNLWVFPSY